MLGAVDNFGSSRPNSFFLDRLLSISRARLTIIALTITYYLAFAWMYIVYISDRYDYFGFGLQTDWPAYDIFVVTLLCIAPSFYIPTKFSRPSALFIYFQYFLIYIPAIWITRHSVLPIIETSDQVLLSAALAFGMFILLLAHHRVPLVRLSTNRLRGPILWPAIYAFAALLLVALIAQLGGNFHLVALADIYTVRQDATDLIDASGSVFVSYAFAWLNGFALPLIFARAISRSRYLELLGVTACFIFLFGIWGSKSSLFSPVILILASVWASQGKSRMPVFMVAAFVLALLVPVFLPFEDGVGALVKFTWLGIVDMRTFSIPGLSISQYFGFFSTHPLTLGSHVTGLNWFISYPYDLDIPRTVGYYYYGHEITANASFWAQDGVAAFGLIGLVFVSFFAAFVLWLLDSATQGLNIRFIITALVGTIVSFTNTSLFTTLVTGGLGLFILASILMPRDQSLRAETAG